MLFLGFALAIGFSYLAQALGLSTSVGAFLAGSLVASLPKGKALEDALSPFTLALSSIFFLAIGLGVNWSSIAQDGVLLLAFIVGGILFKLAGTGISAYLNGFDSKGAAFAAVAMVPTGEFSLVIASQAVKAGSGHDLIGLTSALVFFSTVFSSVFIQRSHDVHALATRFVPPKLQAGARQTAAQLDAIFKAFSHMPSAMQHHLDEAKANVTGTALILAGAVIAWVLAGRREWQLGAVSVPVSAAILVITIILLLPFLARLALEAQPVFSYVRQAVKRQADAGHWLAIAVLALIVLLVPFALAAVGSDNPWLNVASVIVALALLYKAAKRRDPNQPLPSLPKVVFWRRKGL